MKINNTIQYNLGTSSSMCLGTSSSMCLLRLFLLCWIYSISLQSKVLMLTTEYFSIETFQLVCELNFYFLMHSWKDRRFFDSSWLVVTESSRLEWDEWFQHFSDWSYGSWQRPLWNNSRKASISIQTSIYIQNMKNLL